MLFSFYIRWRKKVFFVITSRLLDFTRKNELQLALDNPFRKQHHTLFMSYQWQLSTRRRVSQHVETWAPHCRHPKSPKARARMRRSQLRVLSLSDHRRIPGVELHSDWLKEAKRGRLNIALHKTFAVPRNCCFIVVMFIKYLYTGESQ